MILYEGPLPLSPSHREMFAVSRVELQGPKGDVGSQGSKGNVGPQGPKDDAGPQVSILQKPKKITVLEGVIRDTYGH